MDLAGLRTFALELADAADALSMTHFGGPVPATAKPDGTPVTVADRAIEEALRALIARELPGHAVYGEEAGGALEPTAPTWVLDPIDGTKNFMRGVPVFATLIGLVVDRRAVLGVVSAPAMGERWSAAEGLGAQRNDAPIGVSAVATLADAHVCHGDADRFRGHPALWDTFGRLHDEVWRMRGFGDFWNHLLVATGAADVAFERELPAWDVAALVPIVTEAGGRITDAHGRSVLDPSHAGSLNLVVTTNGVLHDAALVRLAPAVTQEASAAQ
jgi:histidinol-phosphatase